ncbi:MAG TPA: Holliday junction branch migration protein RuvA [Syntrophales bacterium]|nr:Holliday junction branch migration protein RuvA [Syntrophales bacterium]
MIALINGSLIYKSISHVVVEANGIGYQIFIPLTTFYELPEINQKVILHIHTHVRQDDISLFGFGTGEEKGVFELMISVSGIGPKLALNILSGISAEELVRAVSLGNLERLVAIPGVGKKTAERMILELKDKVVKLSTYEAVYRDNGDIRVYDSIIDDVLSALVNLGYKGHRAREVMDKIIKESPETLTLDIMLKKALKILAG